MKSTVVPGLAASKSIPICVKAAGQRGCGEHGQLAWRAAGRTCVLELLLEHAAAIRTQRDPDGAESPSSWVSLPRRDDAVAREDIGYEVSTPQGKAGGQREEPWRPVLGTSSREASRP